MFLITRRWLATAGLLAALLLAVPAPSLAAGRKGPVADRSGLMARAWSLLEKLGLVPMVVWEREGVMIDPNGATTTTTTQASWQSNRPGQEPADSGGEK